MAKWTKKSLVEYLRLEGWLAFDRQIPIPKEVEKILPKIIKELNQVPPAPEGLKRSGYLGDINGPGCDPDVMPFDPRAGLDASEGEQSHPKKGE